jgi:hypothetical protein
LVAVRCDDRFDQHMLVVPAWSPRMLGDEGCQGGSAFVAGAGAAHSPPHVKNPVLGKTVHPLLLQPIVDAVAVAIQRSQDRPFCRFCRNFSLDEDFAMLLR